VRLCCGRREDDLTAAIQRFVAGHEGLFLMLLLFIAALVADRT